MLEATRFNPAEVEPRIIERWLASDLFHPAAEGEGETYSIAIPPPNITGTLHMGHALNNTIQDVLIRVARMSGARTKWILGTDHAGIATQMQVERLLRSEGHSRSELGREAFEARVWEWREHYGGAIIEQLKRLGASCDYRDERFTLDPAYAHAVRVAFVALFEKGYIYRDRYIINWDPGTRSAISDLEVEMRTQTDVLYSIRYDLEGGGELTIATVRPETLLGDTAVAVNPDDRRYRELVGAAAILPLVGRRLPVIADSYVRTDFGSGALKVTPAHDPNDFEIGMRHGLEAISVIGEDGRMLPAAGERFAGLTVSEARAAVVAALREEGRIVGEQPYSHDVPYSHRSGAPIEPLISLQWFMRMDELAAPAAAAVREGRVRIHPESQRRVYLEWLREIRPWCISRQLWWGHRIPVYHCEGCAEAIAAVRQPERCPRCAGAMRQEEDVLDTWFSSALWPFATLGWPQQTPELAAFYPTNVLSTARDILFLWVARMVMMGVELTGKTPFADVYIHSIIQAPDGRRMSKSLGTGIDPLEQIERHGADALRFGVLAMSSAQDVRYSAEKVEQGQKLANKLYNAARFALSAAQSAGVSPRSSSQATQGCAQSARPVPQPPIGPGGEAAIEDRWILSCLASAAERRRECLERFDFAHLALSLYDFVFGELCDWYLEIVKGRLGGGGRDAKALCEFLIAILRETCALAHPVIPFVTEELWSHLGGEGLLAGAPAPALCRELIDASAQAQMGVMIEAVGAIRAWRDAAGVRPGARLRGRLLGEDYRQTAALLMELARIDPLGDQAHSGNGQLASVAIPGGELLVAAPEAVDREGVQARRLAAARRLQGELERARRKLSDERFCARAPAEIVAAERAKVARLEAELARL
ncbi:MAG TPA: valine--tRNA ligase [Solirubrobacteraceae bacterium]|nr:valine--tRNA ligase [Solirubrobacteraceae bacterium]